MSDPTSPRRARQLSIAAVIAAILLAPVLPRLIARVGARAFMLASLGVLYFSIFSLLPLYGLSLGFDTATSARMVAVTGAGLVVCPLAIGWLADRIDRDLLLQGLVALMVAAALALPLAMHDFWLRSVLLFVLGGALIGLYTLGLTLLGQRFAGGRLTAANGAFVLMFGVGEMTGPPFMGAWMDLLPPHGFAWSVACVCAGYWLFLALWRRRRLATAAA